MTTANDQQRCAELCREARTTATDHTIDAFLNAGPLLAELTDQLEAAGKEVERLNGDAATWRGMHEVSVIERDALRAENERLRKLFRAAREVTEVHADIRKGLLIGMAGDMAGPLHRLTLSVDACAPSEDTTDAPRK